MMGVTLATASSPLPALAARVEEEDEGFDLRILAAPWLQTELHRVHHNHEPLHGENRAPKD